jgi:hypothetical protein
VHRGRRRTTLHCEHRLLFGCRKLHRRQAVKPRLRRAAGSLRQRRGRKRRAV